MISCAGSDCANSISIVLHRIFPRPSVGTTQLIRRGACEVETPLPVSGTENALQSPSPLSRRSDSTIVDAILSPKMNFQSPFFEQCDQVVNLLFTIQVVFHCNEVDSA